MRSKRTRRATRVGIHLDIDQPDQARQHPQEALGLHQVTGHSPSQARTLVTLGRALQRTDGAGAALACWREALALFTEIGSPEADQVQMLPSTAHRT